MQSNVSMNEFLTSFTNRGVKTGKPLGQYFCLLVRNQLTKAIVVPNDLKTMTPRQGEAWMRAFSTEIVPWSLDLEALARQMNIKETSVLSVSSIHSSYCMLAADLSAVFAGSYFSISRSCRRTQNSTSQCADTSCFSRPIDGKEALERGAGFAG